MQAEIQKFIFPATSQEVRITDQNGEPWWVLKDVCDVLGLTQAVKVVERLDQDEVNQIHVTDAIGRQQMTYIINEAGLYSVILRSDKPEAKEFKRWVTHEVLPAIRKTGGYGASPEAALNDPASLRGILLNYTEKVIALEAKVAEQAPKVEALKRLEAADGSLCFTNAAKVLKVRPKDLILHLQAKKWIYKRPGTSTWVGYQDKIQAGLVEQSEYTQSLPDGTEKIRTQARITGLGLTKLSFDFGAGQLLAN